jgi:putative oxidoreductase
MNGMLPEPVRDAALLLGRVVLGVVLLAHGWQKLVIDGIAETHKQFEAMGIPLAIASSSFVTFVEFVGGVLLILGALTPVVVVAHLVVMVGAAAFVHVSHGIFAADGGWEVVGVIACAELVLAACGPGRLSVDRLVLSRLRRTDSAVGGDEKSAAGKAATARKAGRAKDAVETPAAEAEPVTSAFPAVNAKGYADTSSLPVFPEQPGTGAFPEQPAGRRRIPRPITPLRERQETPRRTDPRLADRSDGSTAR